jgi:CheY-like chemotaxis protein
MILFVDDEKRYVDNLLEELNLLGREVEFCDGVDKAMEKFQTFGDKIELIVCDVMMPHGKSFKSEETEHNRITGLRFLARVRERGFNKQFVLLTYLEPGRAAEEETARLYPPCRVIRKREQWSFEIAETINKLVKNG